MKLSLDFTDDRVLRIRGYDTDGIYIGDTLYRTTLLIWRQGVRHDWTTDAPTIISAALLDEALTTDMETPEVMLIGTGRRQHFPLPQTLAPAIGQGIGVDIMDTAAACRTYNILVAEGRQAAALLMPPGT